MIMNQQEASMYAELIRALEADRDEIDTRIEMLNDELKEYLKSQGVSSINTGRFKVYWTEYDCSGCCDTQFRPALR